MDLLWIPLPEPLRARLSLPDMRYPLPALLVTEDGQPVDPDLPPHVLLGGLQLAAAADDADWQRFEPAMRRLAEVLEPDLQHRGDRFALDHWEVVFGAVDPAGEVLTIQRGLHVLAAFAQRDDGTLLTAAYRPLDASALERLTEMSRLVDPERGASMGRTPWEAWCDASASFSQMYAADAGRIYVSYWSNGIGRNTDGAPIAEWEAERQPVARDPRLVIVELAAWHAQCRAAQVVASLGG
jgi:hypothetical protein